MIYLPSIMTNRLTHRYSAYHSIWTPRAYAKYLSWGKKGKDDTVLDGASPEWGKLAVNGAEVACATYKSSTYHIRRPY